MWEAEWLAIRTTNDLWQAVYATIRLVAIRAQPIDRPFDSNKTFHYEKQKLLCEKESRFLLIQLLLGIKTTKEENHWSSKLKVKLVLLHIRTIRLPAKVAEVRNETYFRRNLVFRFEYKNDSFAYGYSKKISWVSLPSSLPHLLPTLAK